MGTGATTEDIHGKDAYEDWEDINSMEPKCWRDGRVTTYCNVCGEFSGYKVVPATGIHVPIDIWHHESWAHVNVRECAECYSVLWSEHVNFEREVIQTSNSLTVIQTCPVCNIVVSEETETW